MSTCFSSELKCFSDVPGTVILPEKSDLSLSETIPDFNENSTNNNNSPTQENNIFYSMPEPPPYKRFATGLIMNWSLWGR